LLKVRIKNVKEWKSVLNAIGYIVEDALFIVKGKGITFRSMDSSHVALLDVTFPKESFEEFEGRTAFFGTRVHDFLTIMNTAADTDEIEFNIENNKMMKIKINGSLSMEYNLKLIRKKEYTPSIPKTKFKSKLSFDPSTLSKILSNIKKTSEYVTINCYPESVEFMGGGKKGDAKINLKKGDFSLKELSSDGTSSSAYSIDYIAKIIRVIGKASKIVNMEFNTKNAIHLLFEMPSLARVEYFLAPRIEN